MTSQTVQKERGAVSSQRLHANWIVPCVVALVYVGVLLGTYGVSDDYYWLWRVMHERGQWADYLGKYWSDGRPVQIANLLLLKAVGTVKLLWLARLPGMIATIVLSWRLVKTAAEFGWSQSGAIAIALTIACAPALQVAANWVICANYVFGCLATEWSARAALALGGPMRRHALILTTAVAADVFSFLCFQPAGCFIWVWVALWAGARERDIRTVLRSLSRVAAVFFAAAAVSYLVLRFAPTSNPRAALTTHWIHKLLWFVRHPLSDSLALTFAMHRAVGWLIAGGMVLAASSHWKRLLDGWSRWLVIAVCLPLAYLPNLLITESWVSYRTQIALGPCVATLLWTFLEIHNSQPIPVRWLSHLKIGIAAVLVIGAAAQILAGYTIPQTREWAKICARIDAAHAPLPETLSVRLAAPSDTAGESARYDEFAVPSGVNEWALGPMIRLAFAERGSPYPGVIQFTRATDPISHPFLDMHR